MSSESNEIETGDARPVHELVRTLVAAGTIGLLFAAAIGTYLAAGTIFANDYLSLGYTRATVTILADHVGAQTKQTLLFLLPVTAIVVGLRLLRQTRVGPDAMRRDLAISCGAAFFLLAGYLLNRHQFGTEWKTMVSVLGLPVPGAVFSFKVIGSNLAVALGAMALAGLIHAAAASRKVAGRLAHGVTLGLALLPLAGTSVGRSLVQAPPSNAESLPNVLLITVDTFRGDRLGKVAEFGAVTPRLDALAARGTTFENAYAPSSWTLPSMAAVMTGMYPSQSGAYDYRTRYGDDKVAIAETLQQQGYNTSAIVFSAYVQPRHGFGQGFETFRHFGKSMRREEVSSPQIADLGIEWLEENHEDPFFLFLHFFDPHYNYVSQGKTDLAAYSGPIRDNQDIYEIREIQDRLTQEDLATLQSIYDEEVHFTDHHIGRVLDALDRLGLSDNTIVVFTSDHGEEFLEHGWIGHVKNIYKGMVHVPLIIVDPRLETAKKRIEQPVEIHRIPGTLLDFLEIERPYGAFPGTSLGPLLRGDTPEDPEAPVFGSVFFSRDDKRAMKRSVLSGDWKLIYDYDEEQFELYNVRDDPGETINRYHSEDEVVERLDKLLGTWSTEMDRLRGESGSHFTMDDETLERLRAMGYIH